MWRALTDPVAFGEWFGVRLNGASSAGARVTGQITHEGYEHVPFDISTEDMEEERYLSWRWHVMADPSDAYSDQPTTVVEFELHDAAEGIRLTVVESGFDTIPAAQRLEAYRGNDEGWTAQMLSIKRHVVG